MPFVCLLAASLADKGRLLFGSLVKLRVKLLLAGFGLVLVFASMVESLMFINHSEPYPLIDFKVDYVGNYFPFNVFTPVSSGFQAWHYIAVALILLSFAFPYVAGVFKRGFGGLLKITEQMLGLMMVQELVSFQ